MIDFWHMHREGVKAMGWRLRIVTLFLALCCFMGFDAMGESKAYILMDLDTGRVLYEKNADERLAIASTTKIMTCLLALENSALADRVTASENASGVPGTSIYLSVGETLSMEDMLYGLMLRSGNDAAVAIAEHVAGSVEAFSNMMNERAGAIGADAYFTTPNGLDAGGNGASARGITLITREALFNPDFRRIVGTKKKTIPWTDHEYERVLTNKNKLLSDYEGAIGVKTGFTNKAGRCLVFAAERENMTLVGCVLNCYDWFDEAEKLLDKGFLEYDAKVFLEKGEIVDTILVGGKKVRVAAGKTVKAPLKDGEKTDFKIEIEELSLPVLKGQIVGKASVVAGGDVIMTSDLVSMDTHEKPSFAGALKKVVSLWKFGG